MFGSRLKTWMENYIGRPRKKEAQKDKTKENERGGVILESSESLAHSDTGISSSSQQVLSSSTTDNREGYSTTTMESERSGMTHCHTVVSLPSPESAYSTGYSTDGASPGGTGPPEYYINIRTGKHYFPSPAPTPTSPQPRVVGQLHSAGQRSFLSEGLPSGPPRNESLANCALATFTFPESPRCFPTQQNVPSTGHDVNGFSKSPRKVLSPKSFKLFLKSPKQEKGKPKADINKTPTFENKKKIAPAGKSKKWFKQPFQKFGQKKAEDEIAAKSDPKREIFFDKNICYLLGQENSASPRQRNRIKTNPWLPTEPMSSQNFHCLQINFSPNLTRNRSCSNTPLQNRKSSQVESLENRIKQLNVKYEESKDHLNNLEKAVNRFVGGKLAMEFSDHSEEDLTLNEMMGTYNESYVYEKETDILSDSDPTDCEDYRTDSEADNGGDERDSHDDELDFIDNGSVTESDDNFSRNTGKCTYHDVQVKKNSFLYKNDRHHFRKDSERRRSSRKDQDKARREKRRQMKKSFKREEEDRKKTFEGKPKPKVEIDENVGGLNLSRVLVQRMMAKNVSKSAEGTPVTARRQKWTAELRETHIGNEKAKAAGRRLGILGDAILVDVEADNRYKELIQEAETIFESLRNSPVVKNRKEMSRLGEKDVMPFKQAPGEESLNIWKKTETMCGTRGGPETPARKSPKLLPLELSGETPKKLKRLNFDTNKQISFKARSSAHSPLDPLGPSLRNFAVFKPCDDRKISTSSSEDFEPKPGGTKTREKLRGDVQESPVVPLAFQSVDLGKPLTSYCPQSEPVKRKIYSCSKTYDKLLKQFECKPAIFEETISGKLGTAPAGAKARKPTPGRRLETCLNGNQGPLPKERKRETARPGPPRCPPLGPRRASAPANARSFDGDIFR